MTLANIMGVGKAEQGWKQALKNYIDNPLPSFKNIQPYLPPNYDSIAQDVKGLFKQRLGRDPKEYEIGLLYDVYDAEARKAYGQTIPQDLPDATPVTLDMYSTEFEPQMDVGEQIDPGAELLSTFDTVTQKNKKLYKQAKIYKMVACVLLITLLGDQGSIMAEEMNPDINPSLIDVALATIKRVETEGETQPYQTLHSPVDIYIYGTASEKAYKVKQFEN